MRTKRALTHISTLAAVLIVALAMTACDDPPATTPDQIDIDAESKALHESVDDVRKKADERVASPAESKNDSDEKDDTPEK
ncbi:MAG: hypothetical protein ACQEVA_03475 [Myxococcota bacterium]